MIILLILTLIGVITILIMILVFTRKFSGQDQTLIDEIFTSVKQTTEKIKKIIP